MSQVLKEGAPLDPPGAVEAAPSNPASPHQRQHQQQHQNQHQQHRHHEKITKGSVALVSHEVQYNEYTLRPGLSGVVRAVDEGGDALVRWDEVGDKWLLKKDLNNVEFFLPPGAGLEGAHKHVEPKPEAQAIQDAEVLLKQILKKEHILKEHSPKTHAHHAPRPAHMPQEKAAENLATLGTVWSSDAFRDEVNPFKRRMFFHAQHQHHQHQHQHQHHQQGHHSHSHSQAHQRHEAPIEQDAQWTARAHGRRPPSLWSLLFGPMACVVLYFTWTKIGQRKRGGTTTTSILSEMRSVTIPGLGEADQLMSLADRMRKARRAEPVGEGLWDRGEDWL